MLVGWFSDISLLLSLPLDLIIGTFLELKDMQRLESNFAKPSKVLLRRSWLMRC